ncbi:hypothetical protein D3C75_688350 [compost metagenome]
MDERGETHKYRVIESAAKEYVISDLCKLLRVSRSGYYAFLKRKKTDRDQEAKALIQKMYERHNGVYGYFQIQLFLLQDHGVWMNHKNIETVFQSGCSQPKMGDRHYAISRRRKVALSLCY